MSDIQPDAGSGALDLPEPTFYTPGVDPLPVQPGAAGSAVLLLAGAVDREWAARAAIEIATGWAAAGRRVVLADLHLENPILHELLGMQNLEGIVDIFLYGASISRSAMPVEGRGFHLITAGTYEVDTSAVYRHPRWAKLAAGFRDASATLVLFAPAATVDVEALQPWLGEVVLLGPPREGRLEDALTASRGRDLTMLVPPGFRAPPTAETTISVERVPDPQGPHSRHPSETVRKESRTRRGATVAITLVLLVAMLAAAGFALARYQPELVPWLAPAGTPGETMDATAGGPAAVPVRRAGETVPFAVLVKSYASLGAARQQVEVEQRRFPDTPFYISPEDDSGVLYYKVYAGLLRDTASAERLRERLLQSGAVDSEDTLGALSLIHRAHLSFDLGEFPSRAEAGSASDTLAARAIPTYFVPMPYEDGSRRWQLYGGAYRDSVTADAMRRRLVSAGITPRLVLRVGEPAPDAE